MLTPHDERHCEPVATRDGPVCNRVNTRYVAADGKVLSIHGIQVKLKKTA